MNIHEDSTQKRWTSFLIDSFIKSLRIFGKIALILLVVLAIFVGVVRSLFPYIDQYRSWFEEKLSEAIHQPVKIKQIQASWKGIHPLFRFDDLIILDHIRQTELLRVSTLEVGVGVINSLLHQRIMPAVLRISGMNLSIQENTNQLLEINGIQTNIAMQPPTGSAEEGIEQFFHWLLMQSEISLNQVNIDWHGKNGLLLPLTNVQLTLRHDFLQQQIIGLVTLAEKTPTQIRFVITLHGDVLKRQVSIAEAYFHVKDLHIEPWMKRYIWQGITLTHGHLDDLQMWVNWKEGEFEQIQSIFNVKRLGFYSTSARQSLRLQDFSGNVVWQNNHDGWTFAASHLTSKVNGHVWSLNELGFRKFLSPSDEIDILKLDVLDIPRFDQVLFLFPSFHQPLHEMVNHLQPRGLLKNITLRHDVSEHSPEAFSFAVDFERLDILPWKNIPGIANLNGHLKVNSVSGQLVLNGKNLGVDFPKLFADPFMLSNYVAHIAWLKTEDEWQIHINDFNLQDPILNLSGSMDLFWPNDPETSAFVTLNAGFTENNPELLHRYIPSRILPQGLVQWLNEAFLGQTGNITGQLLLHGPLQQFPFEHEEGRFEMVASVNDIAFNYRAGWPIFNHFTANILLDGKSLFIDTEEAEIFSVKVNHIQGEIADLKNSGLIVQGNIETGSAKGMAFILNSPLNATLGQKLKVMEMSGPIQLDLNLSIPFHPENPPLSVKGEVTLLSDGKLAIPTWDIFLDKLNGAFVFTENALIANHMTAEWLGHPLAINIGTDFPAADESIIHVKVNGSMSVQDIEKHYAINALGKTLTGATNYEAALNFLNKKGKSSTVFSVDSDLSGITVQLPAPLGKKAQEKTPTHIELTFGEAESPFLDIVGKYGNILNTAFRLSENAKEKWQFARGEIRFGSEKAVLGSAPGLRIKGKISALNWSDIEPWVTSLGGEKQQQPSTITIDQIDLSIGVLKAFGFTLQPIHIKVKPQKNEWRIDVDNPDIAGWVLLPQGTKGMIEGEFSRFYLAADTGDTLTTTIRPADLPPLNMLLADFRYGSRQFGKLFFVTSRVQNGMRIDKLILTSPHSTMNATGFWQQLSKGTQSTLSGEFVSNNLGNVLRSMKITESLAETKGRATFALSWPGEIFHPNFARLDGRFSFNFKDGRIINMSQSSEAEMGLGRLLNLLSLQSLPKRLTLDFSDLSQKGFPFDIVSGDFTLNDGNAVTNNTHLNGSLAEVELKGDINLNQKTYNLTMVVTPYVTASLPVVATIAGGPVAGAAAWVAHKVIGRVVDTISSSVYQVTGPWNAPQIVKGGGQRR